MMSWFVLAGNEKVLVSKRQKLFQVFGSGCVLLANQFMHRQSVLHRIKAMSSNFGSPKIYLKNKRSEAKLWHFAVFKVCLVGN